MITPLKLAIQLDGKTLRQLESRTGVCRTTISAIATGRLRPTQKELSRLLPELPSYRLALKMLKVKGTAENE